MKLRRRRQPVAIDVMPLVDVVFLLLTFFVFSLALLVRARVTDITLPALAGGAAGDQTAAVTVQLDQAGRIRVGDLETTAGELGPVLTERLEQARDRRAALGAPTAEEPGEIRVLLAVDAAAPAEDVFRVMLALRDADVGSFGVVTRERQTPAPGPTPRPVPMSGDRPVPPQGAAAPPPVDAADRP